MRNRIALVGASGFVGAAVADALLDQTQLVEIKAPRLTTKARTVEALIAEATANPAVREVAELLQGADVLINAAGNPDASSLDGDALFGANALLPAILLEAARVAKVRRFVHVSSAVVQNDKDVLDSSEDLRPFSPYSASKCSGEEVLRGDKDVSVVRYRPPSVHAPSRRVTRSIRRIASSPVSSVARPGDQPTPQALLPNVAAAVAYLATSDVEPPAVVHHPWEEVTVSTLMEDLSGGRRPARIPRWLAHVCVRAGKTLGRVHKPTAPNARRVELLWFGQRQDESWLTVEGWEPPAGRDGWRSLAQKELW